MAHNQFELLKQRRFLPFFVTQALGAFNDNVFRNATLVLITAHMGLSMADQALYTNLAPALFILPFFFFSASAGQLAEKYEKARIIKMVKLFEIAIMGVAAWGFFSHHAELLLLVLFLMGLHSTVFGPIKYSILPQTLHPEELVGGNGLVETGTSLAILFGMILGGSLMIDPQQGPVLASIAVISIALIGYLASRYIPSAEANAPLLKMNWNPLSESMRAISLCKKQKTVFNAVLGISWFWFFGTALTAQLPVYAEMHLGGGSTLYLLALGVFSIGTGLGSLLCEKLSQRTIEIGLVPFGALGISLFGIDLYFARTGLATETGLSIMAFLQITGSWRIMIDLSLIGLFGGFYLVPLFALVQNRTAKSELSRVIAGTNILNAAFIVSAAVFGIASQRLLHWSIPQFFLAIAILNAVVALYIFSIVPEFFMRFLAWIYIRAMYRIDVHGVEKNVPDEGPALLVCNHVSYMDALILSSTTTRPIRFVMYYKIFNTLGVRWVFKAARAIPIASKNEDAEVMQHAFMAVDQALANGELVCIFPEGRLSPDGEIGPFKHGMQHILATRAVPVVPLAIRGMWASLFSRNGITSYLRIPGRLRAHIAVIAGAPIHGATATVADLEAQVRTLRREWA
jgi:1-acyl-sn-glycerol-3-phosphate acyltransferase